MFGKSTPIFRVISIYHKNGTPIIINVIVLTQQAHDVVTTSFRRHLSAGKIEQFHFHSPAPVDIWLVVLGLTAFQTVFQSISSRLYKTMKEKRR